MYELTKEGERYLRLGLPERRLLEALSAGPAKLEKIKAMQDVHIGLLWAKKNGWVSIKRGEIGLTELGREQLSKPDHLLQALEAIKRSGTAQEQFIDILFKRKLIRKVKKIKLNEIAQLSPEIILSRAWQNIPFKRYDVRSPAPEIFIGKKQAYRAFLEDIKRELIAMGFEEVDGPLVELSFFNMDALYMPQDHPARSVHDIFFVKQPAYGDVKRYSKYIKRVKRAHEVGIAGSTGWGVRFSEKECARLVLRSQGTALSARTLIRSDLKIPGAYFAIARVFRPEKLDATHLMEFNQLEGIILNEKGNFSCLLGLLKRFAKIITGTNKVKFRPTYFPFTEPSVQGYIWHKKLKRWIEMLPAGIFRPELTEPLGIKVPVMAWGLGIDRLFMIRQELSDIRELFTKDLEKLRHQKVL